MKCGPAALAPQICVGFLLLSLPAAAQSGETRDTLLADAQRARDSGDHRVALTSALRAFELKHTSSVARFIAEEQVELEDHLQALRAAQQCLALAEREAPS